MKAGDITAVASSAAISGAGTVLILSAIGLPMQNAGRAFALGAGSELAGDFIYNKLLVQSNGHLIF